ncbi:MAG: WecB/TagA/CpsF family glycosyltransferase [Armatimonadota bacterium]
MSTSQRTGCLIGVITVATGIVGGLLLSRRMKQLPEAESRVELLDVPVDPITMPQALSLIDSFIRSRRPHHIFTADASGIELAQHDSELLEIIRLADLVTPDGAGVLLGTNLLGQRLPERVSGVDLVEAISALAAQQGHLVYLFGAAEGVAQAAAEQLQARHPGLTVVGIRNGYFTPEDEPAIVREIAEKRPDVLFVALGIPKQEKFIRGHFEELGVPVMIGIGGSFDVISGRLQRAPHWMQRSGLEWLYRLRQDPKRLPRLAALPQFIVDVWRSRGRSKQ